jgi:hypothetical protein
MPKLVLTHEVDDVTHWLASPKRAEAFAGIATNLTTYVLSGDTQRVALSMDVADMDALDAMLKSDKGQAAAKHDGVRLGIIAMYIAG